MVVNYFGNYLATVLVGLIGLFVLASLLVNLVIHLICLKCKIKIKFKCKRFHQLVGVEIWKLRNSSVTGFRTDVTDKLFEIFIDKLWISSCYVNRQVNSRILISMNSVRVEYSGNNNINNGNNLTDSKASKKSNLFFVYWLVQFYLKYVGSLSVESLNVKVISLFRNFEVVLNLAALKVEFNENVQQQQGAAYVPQLVKNTDSSKYNGELNSMVHIFSNFWWG